MKNHLIFTIALCASTTMLFAAIPALASSVDIILNVPGVYAAPPAVYVEPRPVYVLPQYEQDWRQRQRRAIEWRDAPRNHGQEVSAAVHERNDSDAHQYQRKNKHGNKHTHRHGD